MSEEQTSTNAPQQNQLAIPIAIIVAGALVALAIIFSGGAGEQRAPQAGNQPPAETGPSDEELLALAAIQEDDYIRGNPDADVYILEFSDTECPFCKRFHVTMLDIMDEYGDRIAWVYRHFPLESLHPNAPKQAEALECAGELGGNDAFWAYTDMIYERTPSNAPLPDADLDVIATDVGLDLNAFTECLDSGRYAEEVQSDYQNAVALGGRGTPHSLIIANGEITPINGAQPFNVVSASLDAILGN